MTARRGASWFGWALLAVTLAGLALRVVFIFTAGPSHVAGDYPPTQKLSGDAVYYHEGANLLATGHGYIDPYRYLYGRASRSPSPTVGSSPSSRPRGTRSPPPATRRST